jgi:epoxyqueuosine reductase
MPDAKDHVKAAAKGLGFDWCGVTTAESLEHAWRYDAWLAAGRQAGMSYLSTERARQARQDPRTLIPSAQSIVVCAAEYPAPTVLPADTRRGGIASYAVGDDYHDILSARMWELCQRIDTLAGRPLRHRVYTDSGPLLERELAVRAGVGWIGRNAMAIHPALGSHFFLAEIVTEIALPPDEPDGADRCGTCRRCLDACPTACILPDRTVDASRCIAYWTIEQRGSILRENRSQMQRWVFGCDVCQSVCPWNQKPTAVTMPCFQAREGRPFVDLAANLEFGEADYQALFHKSALRRARRDGWRRNSLIAAGNAGDPVLLPGLLRALSDPDPMLRLHAAWAVGQFDTPTAQAALRARLDLEQIEEVRGELAKSLSEGSDPKGK